MTTHYLEVTYLHVIPKYTVRNEITEKNLLETSNDPDQLPPVLRRFKEVADYRIGVEMKTRDSNPLMVVQKETSNSKLSH